MIYVTIETLKGGTLRLRPAHDGRKVFLTFTEVRANTAGWRLCGLKASTYHFADLPACAAYIAQQNFNAKRT